MKSNKKGFTLLELIVVIAVIAILAAILIPTFSKIIKNSKVSVDGNLIRNLNTALATDSVKNGKHNTMTDALAAAEKAGYNVGRINKSATDNEILWDSKNDVFCYYNNDSKAGSEIGKIEYIPKTTLKYEKNEGSTYDPEKVNLVDYWVIAAEPSDTYSTYLFGYEGANLTELKTGLDVGTTEGIAQIGYQGADYAKNVVFRTNSAGTNVVLTPFVDSEDSTKGDHISLYGKAGQVTGPKDGDGNYTGFVVAFNSIAINGKVVGLKAESGHIDLTNAIVEEDDEIVILATSTDVKVSNPKNLSTHAHATSEDAANAMNDPADSTKKSVGVTWDYDGNVAQNEIDDIHHHITDAEAEAAGETLGTGPVDGGEWNYEETVESNASQKVTAELNEKYPDADYVARIGLKGYASFDAAWAAAKTNETIVLLKDVSTSTRYDILDKNIKIDLNGKKYEYTGASSTYAFRVKNDYILTIVSSNSNRGVINSSAIGVYLTGGNVIVKNAEMNSSKEAIYCSSGENMIDVVNCDLNATGSSINAIYLCLGGTNNIVNISDSQINATKNALDIERDAVVNLNNVSLTSSGSYVVYMNPQSKTSEMNIVDCNINTSKYRPIFLKNGTINISGNTIVSSSSATPPFIFLNGADATLNISSGVINLTNLAQQTGKITISGGFFNSTLTNPKFNYDTLIKTIIGGTFKEDPTSYINEDQYKVIKNYYADPFGDGSESWTVLPTHASDFLLSESTITIYNHIDSYDLSTITATDKIINSWEYVNSNDEFVAINNNILTGVKGGTTTIKAVSGDKVAYLTITVLEPDAKVVVNDSDVWFARYADALSYAIENDGLLVLNKDVMANSSEATVKLTNKSLTIDLNGHTLSQQVFAFANLNNSILKVISSPDVKGHLIGSNNANLTYKNSILYMDNNSSIEFNNIEVSYIVINNSSSKDTIKLIDAIFRASDTPFVLYDNDELYVENSRILLDANASFGFTVNGTTTEAAIVTIKNSEISGGSLGFYQAGNSVITVEDSTISGVNSAIEIRNGTLTVKDSTLTATATEYHCTANGNGTTTAAAALAVSQHTTKGDIVVTVDGGTLTGYYAVSVANPEENADTDGSVHVTIKSGTTLNATNETKVLVTDTRSNCTVIVEE